MVIDLGRARQLIQKPSVWQRVLHGDVMDLRGYVFEELVQHGSARGAFRYAMCGVGDMVADGPNGVHVAPRGCGHRLCPRCGRKRGGKLARRVLGWLSAEDHGDLWALCLTQRVNKGESLTAARDRMEQKHRKYMRWLTRKGLNAAMSSAHVVWSKSEDGWHYHVHVMLDIAAQAVTKEELIHAMFDGWSDVAGSKETAVRQVAVAGPAIRSLGDDTGSLDYWTESADVVAKAVQYPVRDMCQGVSAWRLGGDEDAVRASVSSLLREGKGWKLSRAWGAWRKPCPAAALPKAEEHDEAASEVSGAAPGPKKTLGSVGHLYWAARRGGSWERKIFSMLERTVHNSGDFAKRFVAFCRRAADAPMLGDSG